jgi:hypothetical protein
VAACDSTDPVNSGERADLADAYLWLPCVDIGFQAAGFRMSMTPEILVAARTPRKKSFALQWETADVSAASSRPGPLEAADGSSWVSEPDLLLATTHLEMGRWGRTLDEDHESEFVVLMALQRATDAEPGKPVALPDELASSIKSNLLERDLECQEQTEFNFAPNSDSILDPTGASLSRHSMQIMPAFASPGFSIARVRRSRQRRWIGPKELAQRLQECPTSPDPSSSSCLPLAKSALVLPSRDGASLCVSVVGIVQASFSSVVSSWVPI